MRLISLHASPTASQTNHALHCAAGHVCQASRMSAPFGTGFPMRKAQGVENTKPLSR